QSPRRRHHRSEAAAGRSRLAHRRGRPGRRSRTVAALDGAASALARRAVRRTGLLRARLGRALATDNDLRQGIEALKRPSFGAPAGRGLAWTGSAGPQPKPPRGAATARERGGSPPLPALDTRLHPLPRLTV